jgi:ATP-binding cassette subfamily C (CFTR/MRP) protein 4
MGMMSRIALTGAIYKKTLELKLKTIGETTIGKIVNLASNDVQRLDLTFFFTSYLIAAPINILIVLVLLWVYIGLGPSSLAGIGLMVLQIPIQLLLGHAYSKLRTASAKQTDSRVKIMNEVISGIRVIKMYGWEYAFKRLISKIRRKESILVTLAAMARAITSAFLVVSPGMVTLLMFSTFAVTTGQPLSPAIVFTSISLLSNLRFTSIMLMLRAILGLQEARVAFQRIEVLYVRMYSIVL